MVKEEPSEIRRLTRKKYDFAESRLRRVFDIADNEYILDFEYDKSNSTLVLTTLIDCDEKQGDR